MATVRELVTKWAFDADTQKVEQFNKGLNNASKRMSDVGGKFQKLGRNLTIGLSLPLIFAGKKIVGIASEAQETESLFRDVFMEITDDAQVMADALSKNFGMARDESQRLLASTADVLIGFGFTRKEALKLSNSIQELSVDLVSFTNFQGGAEGASRALTKGLLGETESLKALNKVVRQEDILRQVQINASKGLTFETLNQAKAQATFDIVLAQSQSAIGNYARTQEDFANVIRNTESAFRDLSASLGVLLLPTLEKIFLKVNSGLQTFNKFDDATKKIALSIGGLGIILPPIILILGALIKSFGVIVGAMASIGPIIGAMALGLKLMIAPLGIVVAGFLVLRDVLAFIDGRKSVLGNILNGVKSLTPQNAKNYYLDPIPHFGGGSTNQNQSNINVNAPINVSVPEGTDQANIGPAITEGIRNAMNDTFRQAINYSSPAFTV